MKLVVNRTPLSELKTLNGEQVTRLEVLGIRSVEALSARLAPLSERQLEAWVKATRLSKSELSKLSETALSQCSDFLQAAKNQPPMLMAKGALPPPGIVATQSTVTPVEPLLTVSRNFSSAGANYISRLGPIRNQGRRGSCVAHAMCALREFHVTAEPGIDLSEQFLYWWCKENDGIPTASGTYIATAAQGLKGVGICREATWPYVRNPGPTEGQGPAPEAATTEAAQFKIDTLTMLPDARDVSRILRELDSGKVVAISIRTYPFWGDAEISRSGQISLPLGEDSDEGHAVLLVGYDPEDESFIFRNSWDDTWAFESPYGPGHGSLPYPYVAQDAWEACC